MDQTGPEGGPAVGADDLLPGVEVDVDVGPLAHGGHCVARHDGRVLFVRHAIPGERVTARVTEGGPGDRFVRADAVAVLEASPHRVTPPCRWAGPGRCGGCDLQHVALEHQRVLTAGVVAEQLARLAGITRDVEVEPLDDHAGLGHRTRVELAVEAGALGLRRHRSHDVVPVDRCLVATPEVDAAIAESREEADADPASLDGLRALDVVAASGEEDTVVVAVPREAAVPPIPVLERVHAAGAAHELGVDARGFWQVHRDAPRALVEAVLDAAGVAPGERVLDLYAGAGLLSLPLADATGEVGQLVAVEDDRRATEHLRDNLGGRPQALVVAARVDEALGVAPTGRRGRGGGHGGGRGGGRGDGHGGRHGGRDRRRRPARSPLLPPSADVVVLDPPRVGAGAGVVGALAALRPRRVVYVACDPSALARDTRHLADAGLELVALRALDAFPMTHHVECVATFAPVPGPGGGPAAGETGGQ